MENDSKTSRRKRTDIVNDIVLFRGDIDKLRGEISGYPWDLEEPIFQITTANLLNVIARAIVGEISFTELEDWANLIECRDDFDFENEELQETIFQLANPQLNGEMTKETLSNIVGKLNI